MPVSSLAALAIRSTTRGCTGTAVGCTSELAITSGGVVGDGQRTVAESLAEGLAAGLRGLATVTSQVWRQFEGGDYQRNYVMPNHRLGHSLLTS